MIRAAFMAMPVLGMLACSAPTPTPVIPVSTLFPGATIGVPATSTPTPTPELEITPVECFEDDHCSGWHQYGLVWRPADAPLRVIIGGFNRDERQVLHEVLDDVTTQLGLRPPEFIGEETGLFLSDLKPHELYIEQQDEVSCPPEPGQELEPTPTPDADSWSAGCTLFDLKYPWTAHVRLSWDIAYGNFEQMARHELMHALAFVGHSDRKRSVWHTQPAFDWSAMDLELLRLYREARDDGSSK